MGRQVREIKRKKRNKNKAGFGAANILVMVVFSGMSYGLFGDVAGYINDIFIYKSAYQDALEIRDAAAKEKEEIKTLEKKLMDPAYMQEYIRGSM